MAIVLIEINKKTQQRSAVRQPATSVPGKVEAAKAQPVAQMAAAMPAATSDPGKVKTSTNKSYLTAFLMLAVIGGFYLISQYKAK